MNAYAVGRWKPDVDFVEVAGECGPERVAFSRSAIRQAWEQYGPSAEALSQAMQKSWKQSIVLFLLVVVKGRSSTKVRGFLICGRGLTKNLNG